MKKILTTIAIAAFAVVSTQAQGLVNAGNNNQTKISTNSVVGGAATGTAGTASGQYYYALFYSTSGSATVGGSTAAFAGSSSSYVFASQGWSDAGILATNSGGTSGRFQSTSANASSVTALPNVGQVVAAQFVYIGWSANIGSTVAALEAYLANPTFAAWFGESAVTGVITTGNGGTQSTPLLFSTGAPQIGGFTLGEIAPTPEPGTIALAGLGIASLFALRRKK